MENEETKTATETPHSNCKHRNRCASEVVCDILRQFDGLFKGVELTRDEWLAYFRVLEFLVYSYPNGQTEHVDKFEAEDIKDWQKKGYSVGDIAFIFRRSKSTIHDVINRSHST